MKVGATDRCCSKCGTLTMGKDPCDSIAAESAPKANVPDENIGLRLVWAASFGASSLLMTEGITPPELFATKPLSFGASLHLGRQNNGAFGFGVRGFAEYSPKSFRNFSLGLSLGPLFSHSKTNLEVQSARDFNIPKALEQLPMSILAQGEKIQLGQFDKEIAATTDTKRLDFMNAYVKSPLLANQFHIKGGFGFTYDRNMLAKSYETRKLFVQVKPEYLEQVKKGDITKTELQRSPETYLNLEDRPLDGHSFTTVTQHKPVDITWGLGVESRWFEFAKGHYGTLGLGYIKYPDTASFIGTLSLKL